MSSLDLSTLVRDYGDPLAEARACRTAAALFDFSFVARAAVEGPDALTLIARLTRRPMADLEAGRIRYAIRVGPDGTLISDLTVWRHGEASFEVMSGRADDIADLARAGGGAVRDLTGETAIFALQGPDTLAALEGSSEPGAISALAYFGHCRARVAGLPCLIGRLGYSGEPGIEIIAAREHGLSLWRALAERARPAGFAAADMLRIEAGFVLFTNEFRVPVSAPEAGLARFAGADGADLGPVLRLVSFRARTPEAPVLWQPAGAPARPTAPGTLLVTSACHSPLAGGTLGLGYALASDVAAGRALSDPSGRFQGIEVTGLPFYDPKKRRPRDAWRAARRATS